MKRTGNIASLFERHAKKKGKKTSMPDVQGTVDVAEEQTGEFVANMVFFERLKCFLGWTTLLSNASSCGKHRKYELWTTLLSNATSVCGAALADRGRTWSGFVLHGVSVELSSHTWPTGAMLSHAWLAGATHDRSSRVFASGQMSAGRWRRWAPW